MPRGTETRYNNATAERGTRSRQWELFHCSYCGINQSWLISQFI